MLSILIIDDSDDKIRVLKSLFRENPSIQPEKVEIADSVLTAINKLSTKRYDLVVLDLYLPMEKGDDALPDGGLQLIQMIEAEEIDDIYKPYHIVGLSREEVKPEHIEVFSHSLWFLLRYNEMDDTWRKQLMQKVSYLIQSKKLLQETATYDFDVAIINALQTPENYWTKKHIANEWKSIIVPGDDCNSYYSATVQTNTGKEIRVVTCFANQMASTASSMLTTKVIYNFRPRYLFMTGIAAAVEEEGINYGDILVATEVWDGASGKYKDTAESDSIFMPDYRQKALNSAFLNIVTQLKEDHSVLRGISDAYPTTLKPSTNLMIHTGPMASVPAVIASADELNKIKGHARKLLGIEMEAYGMFYAAENAIGPRPQIVASLKSVSDYATKSKSDQYQDYASYTSVALLKYIILNRLSY